jgi:hypothetical protein
MKDVFETLIGLFMLAVIFIGGSALYLLPTIIALLRRTRNIAPIAVINIMLGWSIFGWVGALAMAIANEPTSVQVRY